MKLCNYLPIYIICYFILYLILYLIIFCCQALLYKNIIENIKIIKMLLI